MDTRPASVRSWFGSLYRTKDRFWFAVWLAGIVLVFAWDAVFLNTPAFLRIQTALINSLLTGAGVVLLSLVLGWSVGVGLYLLGNSGSHVAYGVATLATDVLRSVPQIVAVLIGYVVLTLMVHDNIIQSTAAQLVCVAVVIAIAVFLEIADTVRTRIEHFRTLDFVDAMLCCGISEWRIINVEILWKNSRSHLLHKLISVFGVTIFLQCSIDFIVSVGLSTDVSLANLPLTLGSLLANIDSKQDILAVSNLITDPGYITTIVVRHLQGITVAFCIVFTLLCVYMIANGYVRRKRLA